MKIEELKVRGEDGDKCTENGENGLIQHQIKIGLKILKQQSFKKLQNNCQNFVTSRFANAFINRWSFQTVTL